VIRAVVLMLLLAGCSALPLPGAERRASEALLSRGDELSASGRYAEAAGAYRQVVETNGVPELRARALFELGRLANEPGNPDRDAAAASAYFDRLRREHPTSNWAPYARAWRETLEELSRTRSETARIEQEVAWLRQQVRELSATNRELTAAGRELTRLRLRLAEAEREAASLREDLDRLKALELELDRLRRPRR